MTTLIVRWATGLLRLTQGRFEEALAGLAEAQQLGMTRLVERGEAVRSGAAVTP